MAYLIPKKLGPRKALILSWASKPNMRWTVPRRIAVVHAVQDRLFTEAEAKASFQVSDPEWREWVRRSLCT